MGWKTFSIDFDDLERKAADPEVKLMLLCNPHNPAGRVWSKQELCQIGEICIRNGVTVIADEIHCELVFPENVYTPFASLSEKFQKYSVTCVSPSKLLISQACKLLILFVQTNICAIR